MPQFTKPTHFFIRGHGQGRLRQPYRRSDITAVALTPRESNSALVTLTATMSSEYTPLIVLIAGALFL